MSLGFSHLHLRKRTHKRFGYFDRLMLVVGTLSPLALLPQVLQVFIHRDVAGLSLLTWLILSAVNSLWTVYGLMHREPPIWLANLGMTILDLSIVLGILLFR